MSIQAVAWVLEHSGAALADRLVLIAIANHCDGRGWNAYPAIDLIAQEARVGRSTAIKSVQALELIGELTVERRPGRANIYGIPALMGSRIETPLPVQDLDGGVQDLDKRGPGSGPKPLRTVTQPSRTRGDLSMPPELPADVKAKGKEFFKQLRNGERPA